ncbi:Nif3-like dinuclear metal center hexameric protein [Methanoplanus sp. FWC-SCC4]|uniref:Nif3-like dinuclear metal center hexameric protein n=1 Tax=Methanochimaera problematica TaxID=2609417 RepID=A0AA97I428_9EURY|nr:Nif3-like dinuclear metal center hexameric protein [Methanoplanus sp. FWC-SCC4]WOF15886.1 Nif3-like dinuclear metal center hexameric protein [Methanoplanus sp. FWC-SCC4]
MHIEDFVRLMEDIAPPDLAEDFDESRIGLVVEGKRDIENVACALDATLNTVSDAVSINADMLVVHHTPIWNPVTRISGIQKEILQKALASDLNIYVMHTNYDHADGGINDSLSALLNLRNCRKMSLGIIGDCSVSLEEISKITGSGLRVYGEIKDLKNLAIVGGSGFDPELINEAKNLGADAFLSSELKHSVILSSSLPLIESTHYALESPGMKMLSEKMGWTFIDDKPAGRLYL